MKKKIGIVGLDNKIKLSLKKKYKQFKFLSINDKNLFSKSTININALVVLYEYPLKKKLSFFLKKGFKLFKNLEWLHLTRAGVDECLPFLKDYKFIFTCGKKIQAPNVSEHCIALLLSLTRGLFDQNDSNNFNYRPTEISGQKILIVGLGGIGAEIAKKLYHFNCEIHSITRSFKKKLYIKKNYPINKIIKVIGSFDIVINTLPYTKETKDIFNKKIFKKMKNKSIFISVSRDKTINLKDLKNFIKKKKFSGVAIDNTGSFKMKKKIIYKRKYNFIITNHLGGVTTNSTRKIKLTLENIDAFISDKKLKHIVSKKRGY